MQSLTSSAIEGALSIYNAPGFGNNHSERNKDRPFGKWTHTDNIGYGSLGKYIFLSELYKHTREPVIWQDLLNYLKAMEAWHGSVTTNNYSLYYGRSGLCYLYFRIFIITQDEQFLHNALKIARNYLQADHHHLRIYDKNGLVDGTAGTLLLYTALHNETKEDWLLDYIRQALPVLIDKAQPAKQGMYWINLGISNSIHTGWAYGSSGIALCLLELGKYFNDEQLSSLGDLALSQEHEILKEKGRGKRIDVMDEDINRFDPSMEGIYSGHLVRLYAAVRNNNPQYKDHWEQLATRFDQLLSTPSVKNMPAGLFNGLAGWGLAFKEAYWLTNNVSYLHSSDRIAAILTERLSEKDTDWIKDPGFFHGISGVGYFLVRSTDTNFFPSLLLPRIIDGPVKDKGPLFPGKDSINITQSITDKLIFRKQIEDRAAFLEQEYRADLAAFLNKSKVVCTPSFGEWMYKLYKRRTREDEGLTPDEKIDKVIVDNELLNRSRYSSAEDDILFAQQFDRIRQLPVADFLRLKLSVSNDIFILWKEEFFDLSKPLTLASFTGLFSSYGATCLVFRVTRFGRIEMGKLDVHKLNMDLFISPSLIDGVVKKLVDFIMAQDEKIVALARDRFRVSNNDQLRQILTRINIDIIRGLLMEGFLEIVDL